MYANELLFVDKFLAKLKTMKVESIPFRTTEYRDGVHAMKVYFRDHMNDLDVQLHDIRLLFLNGGQKDFADAIMTMNGDRISLQNPYLESANIKTTDEMAEVSLADNKRLDISDTFLTDITKEFCKAAKLI